MEATKQAKAALKHKEMRLRGKAHQKTVTDKEDAWLKGKDSILGQSEYMAHDQNMREGAHLITQRIQSHPWLSMSPGSEQQVWNLDRKTLK